MLWLILHLSGCVIIPEAIEHIDLRVGLKMTDTIFLEPVKKAKNRDIYIEVRNTSELQEVNTDLVKNLLISRLQNKGYIIKNDPTNAGYIL